LTTFFTQGQVKTSKSIKGLGTSVSAVELVNDATTPGVTKYYGTDGTGVKGWYDVPGGEGSTPSNTSPPALGVADPGVSLEFSRGDHVHPSLTVADLGAVPDTRLISTGTGLSGGGSLVADRTLSVIPDTTVQRVQILLAGTTIGERPSINFTQGGSVHIGVSSNPGSNRIDVSVSAPAAGDGSTFVTSNQTGLSTEYVVAPMTADGNVANTLTANRIYATPVYIAYTRTFTRIGARSGTWTSLVNSRLGSYNDANGKPGTLVLDAGVVTFAAATTNYELTISQQLAPGKYWLVCLKQNAGTAQHALYGVTDSIPVFGYNSALTRFASLYRTYTYGALPADETAQTYTLDTTASPIVWLRVA